MSNIAIDIQKLYERTFGSRYVVQPSKPSEDPNQYSLQGVTNNRKLYSNTGSPLLVQDAKGVDIWLPTELYNLYPYKGQPVGEAGRMKLYYSTINISAGANVIRTSMAERIGSVKEVYNIDDYKITIKGFFIDKEGRSLPESDIDTLNKVLKTGKPIGLYNAISDIILADDSNPGFDQQQVLLTRFTLMEITGGRRSMRPFVMEFESDNIFTLEVQ